jgi:NAD(P)-dependent dehydrogenase (short-subunit alcohol dehydrogenase family)
MYEELRGRTVLITGGASGIGAEAAIAFAAAGAAVVLVDRDAGAGQAVVKELAATFGSPALFREADVRDPHLVTSAVEAAVVRFGRLDVLFNNAGVGFNAPLVDHPDEAIDDLLGVNLRATILASRAALPHLLRNASGGVIVNNASNGGVIGRAPDPVYCASKHGVVGFTKSLALAHAHEGLRVNAICPGPIDTPMLWGNFAGVPRAEAARKILASCPDPRIATAAEVAATVLFLASDSARFVNGVSLPIDGAKAAGTMPAHRYRLDFELRDAAEAER